MSKFWLIRHGESESNAGLSTGPTDQIALTARGRAQAQALPAAFGRAPDLIVASAYRRALETAQPLRARFPQAIYAEWPIHECVTLAHARRLNTTPEQRRPLMASYWERCDPHYVDGDGAESFAQLVERAHSFLERLRHLDAEFAVFVGHGLFTRTLLWLHMAAPATVDAAQMRAYRGFLSGFRIPNASIVEVYRNSRGCLLFGTPSVAHLPPQLRPAALEPTLASRPHDD